MVKAIIEKENFLSNIQDKNAEFLLAGSVTKTCQIEGITQAGIPGLIHLTPTLDGEFVDSGKLFSLKDIAQTPKGVPTPAIITRAVRNLTKFDFGMLDLGLVVLPKVDNLYQFDIKESLGIDNGAGIDAKELISKGISFGKSYKCEDDFLILGESTPSGTTTARAVAQTLGYDVKDCFSSSFLDAPKSLKDDVIKQAQFLADKHSDLYAKLGVVSDNMLLFCAGFVSSFSQKSKVILAGGTQMAAVMLILDALGLSHNVKNIALMTTKWVYEDKHSDIKALLELLSEPIDAYYADFDFSSADIEVLKLYDKGEAKEGVGAGGALCYAYMKGYSKEEITKEVQKVLVG